MPPPPPLRRRRTGPAHAEAAVATRPADRAAPRRAAPAGAAAAGENPADHAAEHRADEVRTARAAGCARTGRRRARRPGPSRRTRPRRGGTPRRRAAWRGCEDAIAASGSVAATRSASSSRSSASAARVRAVAPDAVAPGRDVVGRPLDVAACRGDGRLPRPGAAACAAPRPRAARAMIASAAWFAASPGERRERVEGPGLRGTLRLVEQPLGGGERRAGIAGCRRRATRGERRLGAHARGERRERPAVGDAGAGCRHVRRRRIELGGQARRGLVEARSEPLHGVEEAGRTRDALLRAAEGDDCL